MRTDALGARKLSKFEEGLRPELNTPHRRSTNAIKATTMIWGNGPLVDRYVVSRSSKGPRHDVGHFGQGDRDHVILKIIKACRFPIRSSSLFSYQSCIYNHQNLLTTQVDSVFLYLASPSPILFLS